MSALQAAGWKTHLHVLLLGAAGTIYSEWRVSLTTLGMALPIISISTLTNKLHGHAITSAHSLNGVRLSLERSPPPSAQMGGLLLSPCPYFRPAPTAYRLPPLWPAAYGLLPPAHGLRTCLRTCRLRPTSHSSWPLRHYMGRWGASFQPALLGLVALSIRLFESHTYGSVSTIGWFIHRFQPP
jgi:hypothetical protein